MKLLLENWKSFLNESNDRPDWQKQQPELYGNCGMFALALLLEGIERGKKGMEIVLVHDSPDINNVDEANIYHVALWYNGNYYDSRGKISREQVGEFAPLGLTTPEGSKPKEGKDYLLDSYMIENMDEWKVIEPFIVNNTDWTAPCKEYKDRAKKFWDMLDS